MSLSDSNKSSVQDLHNKLLAPTTNAETYSTQRSNLQVKRRKSYWKVITVTFTLILLTCLVLTWVYLRNTKRDEDDRDYQKFDCLLSMGTIQQTERIHNTEYCQDVIKNFVQKSYLPELREIGDDAIKKLKEYASQNQLNGNQLLVFDIDETALSNQIGQEEPSAEQKIVTKDRIQQLLERQNFLPPLDAIKKVYQEAFKMGFSVSFLTGRYEKYRNFTLENLERMGYGQECNNTDYYDNRRQFHERDHQNSTALCYVQLDLRSHGERHLPASVYKPQRRKLMEENGYEIIASFGDQWSDLLGTNQALYSYKLPNPFYYIL